MRKQHICGHVPALGCVEVPNWWIGDGFCLGAPLVPCGRSPDFQAPNLQLSLLLGLSPLFVKSVMPCTEAEWWLLDTGASVTVLSERHVGVFSVELTHAGYSDDQTFFFGER